MEPHATAGRSDRPLVILGASVRAVAASASRAGWTVYAADLFRDLDLVAVSRTAVLARHAAEGYPWSLATASATFPPSAPWCYTGGLENYPDLLDAIASQRPLAGNPAAVIGRVRDPDRLAAVVTACGLRVPDTYRHPDGLPTDGSYLVKPLAAAGGRGILPWTESTATAWRTRHDPAARRQHVWQRLVEGAPMAAGYVMSAGSSRLLGVTTQLVGAAWCHAARFAWCGGVTDDRPELAEAFERLGTALAAGCGLVGAIGVDAVVDSAGRISVLEVNPRPTASMELFERSSGVSIAGAHLAACGQSAATAVAPQRPGEPGGHWAKAVLFADRDVTVTESLVASLLRSTEAGNGDDGGWAALADIPAPSQVVTSGAPLCTLFARGRRPADAVVALRRRVTTVDRLVGSAPARGTSTVDD